MHFIIEHLLVLKLDKFNFVKDEHSENIKDISFTFAVLKEDKLREFNFEQR